ncbi:hypothetical protein RI367_005516 [Sorochytrium milnesiophthora]
MTTTTLEPVEVIAKTPQRTYPSVGELLWRSHMYSDVTLVFDDEQHRWEDLHIPSRLMLHALVLAQCDFFKVQLAHLLPASTDGVHNAMGGAQAIGALTKERGKNVIVKLPGRASADEMIAFYTTIRLMYTKQFDSEFSSASNSADTAVGVLGVCIDIGWDEGIEKSWTWLARFCDTVLGGNRSLLDKLTIAYPTLSECWSEMISADTAASTAEPSATDHDASGNNNDDNDGDNCQSPALLKGVEVAPVDDAAPTPLESPTSQSFITLPPIPSAEVIKADVVYDGLAPSDRDGSFFSVGALTQLLLNAAELSARSLQDTTTVADAAPPASQIDFETLDELVRTELSSNATLWQSGHRRSSDAAQVAHGPSVNGEATVAAFDTVLTRLADVTLKICTHASFSSHKATSSIDILPPALSLSLLAYGRQLTYILRKITASQASDNAPALLTPEHKIVLVQQFISKFEFLLSSVSEHARILRSRHSAFKEQQQYTLQHSGQRGGMSLPRFATFHGTAPELSSTQPRGNSSQSNKVQSEAHADQLQLLHDLLNNLLPTVYIETYPYILSLLLPARIPYLSHYLSSDQILAFTIRLVQLVSHPSWRTTLAYFLCDTKPTTTAAASGAGPYRWAADGGQSVSAWDAFLSLVLTHVLTTRRQRKELTSAIVMSQQLGIEIAKHHLPDLHIATGKGGGKMVSWQAVLNRLKNTPTTSTSSPTTLALSPAAAAVAATLARSQRLPDFVAASPASGTPRHLRRTSGLFRNRSTRRGWRESVISTGSWNVHEAIGNGRRQRTVTRESMASSSSRHRRRHPRHHAAHHHARNQTRLHLARDGMETTAVEGQDVAAVPETPQQSAALNDQSAVSAVQQPMSLLSVAAQPHKAAPRIPTLTRHQHPDEQYTPHGGAAVADDEEWEDDEDADSSGDSGEEDQDSSSYCEEEGDHQEVNDHDEEDEEEDALDAELAREVQQEKESSSFRQEMLHRYLDSVSAATLQRRNSQEEVAAATHDADSDDDTQLGLLPRSTDVAAVLLPSGPPDAVPSPRNPQYYQEPAHQLMAGSQTLHTLLELRRRDSARRQRQSPHVDDVDEDDDDDDAEDNAPLAYSAVSGTEPSAPRRLRQATMERSHSASADTRAAMPIAIPSRALSSDTVPVANSLTATTTTTTTTTATAISPPTSSTSKWLASKLIKPLRKRKDKDAAPPTLALPPPPFAHAQRQWSATTSPQPSTDDGGSSASYFPESRQKYNPDLLKRPKTKKSKPAATATAPPPSERSL